MQDIMPSLPEKILAQVTILVPIGPGESSWRDLLTCFSPLALAAEVLLIATEPPPKDFDEFIAELRLCCQVQWIQTLAGRARQMNFGANLATREFVWFLHADSQATPEAIAALEKSLAERPNAMHYFDLAFQNDGPRLVQWNALGARFRSRILQLPFGDQGFCLRRTTFQQLGQFDETARYGEDHLLVWSAHRERIPLQRVNATLSTSARKYATNGWLRTTGQHFWRTWSQAISQCVKLLRSRLK